MVDSGASHPVADPRKHFPGSTVRPSAASQRGLKYAGAGSETIANEGEMDCRLMTSGGIITDTTWQAAAVRRPLLAVSACTDKQNLVVFDNALSCILSGGSPEVKEIRKLLQKATMKIPLEREGGIFTMRTWKVPPRSAPATGFPRQGR